MSMKAVTKATTKSEKAPVKVKRSRKTKRPVSVQQSLPLTGSLGGETTVYVRRGDGLALLRKSAFFSEEEWEAILAEKKRSKTPATEVIRNAVRQYLDL